MQILVQTYKKKENVKSHFGKLVNKKFGTLLHVHFVDLNNLKIVIKVGRQKTTSTF